MIYVLIYIALYVANYYLNKYFSVLLNRRGNWKGNLDWDWDDVKINTIVSMFIITPMILFGWLIMDRLSEIDIKWPAKPPKWL